MKLMVEQALTQYDYVIIDTAPLTVSNDGAVFGRWAKGLLLVVSRNVCEKKSLQEAADTLATAQVPVLGFIFSRAVPKKVNSHSNYYSTMKMVLRVAAIVQTARRRGSDVFLLHGMRGVWQLGTMIPSL